MYGFAPTEEQKMLVDAISRYSKGDLRPAARDAEESRTLPPALVEKGWELGFLQASVPETYGGFGERSAVSGVLAAEELAYGDLAGALAIMLPATFAIPILVGGSDEQKKELMPEIIEGSWAAYSSAFLEPSFDFDPNSMKTTAKLSGEEYVLNGVKTFVPFAADAQALVIYASLNDQTQAFLVRKGTPGLAVSEERQRLLGMNALPFYEVKLEGVHVPKTSRLGGEAGHDFTPLLAAQRLANAALAVGVARAAFEFARDYAKEREAFGVKIAQKQAIAFMLAEMATEIEASRLLTWEAAWKLDSGKEDYPVAAFLASTGAADMAMTVTDRAVQILGGYGYIREFPVEMWMRNGRGFSTITGLASLKKETEMTIEFEAPKPIAQQQFMLQTVADEMMRPHSRYFDEHEHEIPFSYIEFMHSAMRATGAGSLAPREKKEEAEDPNKPKRPPIGYQMLASLLEMLSWGDVGMYLVTPGGGLGAAAVQAAASDEQKVKFLSRFGEEKPTFAAMCMTEPQAGSDTSAIRTRAVLDEATREWVINGEKIFVTGGEKSLVHREQFGNGFIVVWASIDPTAGRAGMRAFVVEAGTPGVAVTKLEHKLGIRCSDTAAISLVDARVPYDHILGSPTVEKTTTGFKGAMATFDATRPLVAATGIGVARAALEEVKKMLADQGVTIRYGLPRQKQTAIEKDIIDMEIMLRSAWLMVLKAVWMADNKHPNALESSMSKVKAGDVVTKITQKAVELMGPLGYSREYLLEKWFRDAKITDIYEGTGQINRLVVARQLLGYSGAELR